MEEAEQEDELEAEKASEDEVVILKKKPAEPKRKRAASKPKMVKAIVAPAAVLPVVTRSSRAIVVTPVAPVVVSTPVLPPAPVFDEAELSRRLDERMQQFVQQYQKQQQTQEEEQEKKQKRVVEPVLVPNSVDTPVSLVVASNHSAGGMSNQVVRMPIPPTRVPSPLMMMGAGSSSIDFSSGIAQAVHHNELMHSFELNAMNRANNVGTLLSYQSQQQQQQQLALNSLSFRY